MLIQSLTAAKHVNDINFCIQSLQILRHILTKQLLSCKNGVDRLNVVAVGVQITRYVVGCFALIGVCAQNGYRLALAQNALDVFCLA